jgi:NADH-quinone oxidoreductase subunit L
MEQAWLLPAIPAVAFVILALTKFLRVPLPREGDFIGVGASIAIFIIMLMVAGDLFGQLPVHAAELVGNNSGFDWIKFDVGSFDFVLRVGFHVDQITVVMLIVVTFVGMLVNIYSLGYMHGEPRYGWYYAVLALFVASMLALVLADNFLLLYVTWEGVGVCSFLLIGFYYERRSAAEAAKKAFVTTRFGDVLMLIGIILLWREAKTFDMSTIFHMAESGEFDKWYLTMSSLFLFGGAAGKSAQFPFHVWLPDAMEGPTPVSALIHAATMVVAGVYLVARAMPLFEAAYPIALDVIMALGLITTFLSAFMGLAATDIKRVVAYSTLNSLGLMMVALGIGEHGVGAAMVYLFVHAFFKACLFLCCGSVIHATHVQEVSELGGLKNKMPITNAAFFIGAMAMAGLVPFSGFFAKDEIVVMLREYSTALPMVLVLISVPITAIYMFRVYILTFLGEPRDQHNNDHAHESEPVMAWPLLLLGGITLVAGFVVFEPVGRALGFGSGVLGMVENVLEEEVHGFSFDWPAAIISTILVLGGLVAAWMTWAGEQAPAKAFNKSAPGLVRLASNRFYIDDIYQWGIDNVVLGIARFVALFDRAVVNDTGINGPGHVAIGLGWFLKFQQTGKLPNYALAMTLGVVVLVVVGFSVKG